MQSKHAISIYKDHLKTLQSLKTGAKEDIENFIKNALRWAESFQAKQNDDELSQLENQLKNI